MVGGEGKEGIEADKRKAGLLRKDGFSSKKRSDRAQVLFAVGMCQNHVVSDDCCGTPFCAETVLVRHRFASNF